ncbi:leucine-rich repeat-containing protein 52-like [Python bivittatus]|uniref:Leucine-rich repeat-containing protein 52-like n=1 Tax=Python bivittatus TaxID=176946 RepID=A0A9F5J2X9_PYTBI|nr:leucine-rich repeat-containing protein 52-like [Python bivittatus]
MTLALGMKWIEKALSCPAKCTCNKWEVNCTGMNLDNIPTTIPLTSKKLILAQNNLTNLPPLTMSYLDELVHLDCSHNLITMDLDFSFPGLVKLTYLDLSFNRLSHITSFTFSQLSKLLLLNLSGNPMMVEIKEWAFEKNTLLRYIDVSDCGLAYLNAEIFNNLYRLRILGINGNPWNCDCKFLTFCKWLKNTAIKSPDFENTTCSKPEKMKGLSLIEVETKLHYLCLLHLETEDFIYMSLLTFCVFFGGTLVAWLVGFGTVIYYHPVMRIYDEPENEEYRMI